MKDKRITWIDEIRGLAIILVVIGHVIGGLDVALGGGKGNIIYRIIYSFHMPLMFIISGLVSSENKNDGMRHFCIKIFRIFIAFYIPYLLWGYIFWAVKYFIYAGNEGVSLEQCMKLCWNCAGWPPGWYLLTLLFVKLLDIIIDSCIHNIKAKMAIWIILFILGGGFKDIYLISRILKFGIYYQIGKQIKNIGFHENSIINSKNCFILLCVASIFSFADDCNYIMEFGIAVSLSVMIILLFSQSKYHSTVILTIGRASMVPYVLHAYMTIPIRIILRRYNVQDFAVYVIAETASAILFSLIIINIINRYKWVKALFYPTVMLKKEK